MQASSSGSTVTSGNAASASDRVAQATMPGRPVEVGAVGAHTHQDREADVARMRRQTLEFGVGDDHLGSASVTP